MTTRRKIVFDHDRDPDFSWLEQSMYDPSSPDYSPTYRTAADMKAKRNPMDGEWYRNPDNHVALAMVVYEMSAGDSDWRVVDSLCSIDFLADGRDWTTGTFYAISEIPKACRYQRTLAREAKLRR